jgi:hypothetical protein
MVNRKREREKRIPRNKIDPTLFKLHWLMGRSKVANTQWLKLFLMIEPRNLVKKKKARKKEFQHKKNHLHVSR